MKYYIYGLQRSGTNVLQKFLETNFNISFLNQQYDRQIPSHKHFRIYNDKDIIPETDIENQYQNKYKIQSLQELDECLGDFEQTNRYIIVYKNIFSWLPSIEKWANLCKWKTHLKMQFVKDYLHFLEKWNSLKNERVFFINYDEFLNVENNTLMSRLTIFLKKTPEKNVYSFDKVNCSNVFTLKQKEYYLKEEYKSLYSRKEIDEIQKNTLYKELKNSLNI